jgi:4-carboxymuconolactone decarboxylase
MTEHLPEIYTRFRRDYPSVAAAEDAVAEAVAATGSLDERTRRLVTLGIAVGALAEGSVRSNARRALALGTGVDEVRQARCARSPLAVFPQRLPRSAGSTRSWQPRPKRCRAADQTADAPGTSWPHIGVNWLSVNVAPWGFAHRRRFGPLVVVWSRELPSAVAEACPKCRTRETERAAQNRHALRSGASGQAHANVCPVARRSIGASQGAGGRHVSVSEYRRYLSSVHTCAR